LQFASKFADSCGALLMINQNENQISYSQTPRVCGDIKSNQLILIHGSLKPIGKMRTPLDQQQCQEMHQVR
jgi:hypothetical protein